MSLRAYEKKRNFRATPEPPGSAKSSKAGLRYVVQKHDATRLHYDFRLEYDGALKSWAVPKGPSLDPTVKVLAVEVEDHPLEYRRFEGTIPAGNYGAGNVIVWDQGTWTPLEDPKAAFRKGRIKFQLHGEKLKGVWNLVRMRSGNGDRKNWLLIKHQDDFARRADEYDVLAAAPDSVLSGKPLKLRERRSRVKARSTAGERASAEPLPGFSPQLATRVERPPEGADWLHEIKFDGYRLICRKSGKNVRLITRSGQDWTGKFAGIARDLAKLRVRDAILDGEVVVLAENGVSDFQRLQNAMKSGATAQLRYCVFDLPWSEGRDLRNEPLEERKRRLREILQADGSAHPSVVYSDHVQSRGGELLALACRQGLEGLISKRRDSRYEQRRSRNWLKSKCRRGQEFVIGGFTDPTGNRTGFGALLLGYYEDAGTLHYCGRVGTGFDEATLSALHKRLRQLEQDRTPFAIPPTGAAASGVHWVEPKLVANVTYHEATRDHQLRQPVFHGLREDKLAAEVVWEARESESNGRAPGASRRRPITSDDRASNGTSRAWLTHPGKVLIADAGLTKESLADYCETVSEFMLPHVVDRPLMLIRCPNGVDGSRFVQKHWTPTLPKAIQNVEIREKSETKPYIVVRDQAGLVALAQISAIEVHPWGSGIGAIETPDRLIFDLDPGPDVKWARVVEGAMAVREELNRVNLTSFVKTSGGKGLHVVVPLRPRASWDAAKDFAREIAERVAMRSPGEYVTSMSKSRRIGRIFIDFHRNGRGATCVAVFSPRAKEHAPVSAPIAWSAIRRLESGRSVTIADIRKSPERFAKAWKGFWSVRQSLPAAGPRERTARGK